MHVIGREAELAVCRSVLFGDRVPACMLIEGEAGIGKTVLHRSVMALAKASGRRVLSTTGVKSEITTPLANLADLLETAAAEVLGTLPAVQAEALAGVLRLTGNRGRRIDPALLARATVNTLAALASGGGLLVAIDDEQWVDADTRKLLGTTVTWLGDGRVSWLVSARTGDGEEAAFGRILSHELDDASTRLRLTGLDAASLIRMITDRFPGRWSHRLLDQIVALGDGNPYTVLETARETVVSAGRDAVAPRVPAGLAQALRVRLNRLSPAGRAVVQVAALGARPTRGLIREVTGVAGDDPVDEVLVADVLTSSPPDPVLRFSHPLLREVAQSMVDGPARRRLHRALAAAVGDPDEAAGHHAAGAEEPDEAIAALVEAAAHSALTRTAPARAVALAEMAVALTPDPDGLPAWGRRLLRLEALLAADERDRCRELAEKWAGSAPAALKGEVIALLGEAQYAIGDGVTLMSRALPDLEHTPARAADIGTQLAIYVGILLLRLDEGRLYAAEAVRHAESTGEPAVLRTARGVEGQLSHLAGDPEAGRRLTAAVALPGLTDMREPYHSPEVALAWWHMCRGDLGEARRLLHDVLAICEQRGREDNAIGVRLHLTEVEWRAGHWTQAAEHADVVEAHARKTGYAQPGVPAYVVSMVSGSRGEVDRARAAAEHGVRAAEEQGDHTFGAQCRFVLGQLALSLDDPIGAVTWLDPLAGPFARHGFGEPGLFPFPPDLAEAYARVGRFDEARAQLQMLRRAAEELDHLWARITGGRAAAAVHLALRDPASAVAAASGVLPEARQAGLPLELGRTLLVLGTAQRRYRRRREAAATLAEAVSVLDGLGARCWAGRAREQLARLVHSAAEVLTPAEQRVAELVGEGRTNVEIAGIMLISVKTVEANLTRIYRKLDVRGRVELARRYVRGEGFPR